MIYSQLIAEATSKWRYSDAFKKGVVRYSARLEERNMPVIFDLKHLSSHTDVEPPLLGGMITRPQRYYREFDFPKRSGGFRRVAAPTPYLLHVQRWILDEILYKKQPGHGTASPKGIDILANAKAHLGNPWLLKTDIRDFFGSCTRASVEEIFLNAGYSPKVAYFLSKLCTLYARLPQGAATSSALGNLIIAPFDRAMNDYASRNGMKYTRYVDDITMSGDSIPDNCLVHITSELNSNFFSISQEKTIIAGPGDKKIITGISIGSGRLKLPRQISRQLRMEVHYIDKFGLNEHIKRAGITDPIYRFRLAGRLAFWTKVEPDCGIAKHGLALLAAYAPPPPPSGQPIALGPVNRHAEILEKLFYEA